MRTALVKKTLTETVEVATPLLFRFPNTNPSSPRFQSLKIFRVLAYPPDHSLIQRPRAISLLSIQQTAACCVAYPVEMSVFLFVCLYVQLPVSVYIWLPVCRLVRMSMCVNSCIPVHVHIHSCVGSLVYYLPQCTLYTLVCMYVCV